MASSGVHASRALYLLISARGNKSDWPIVHRNGGGSARDVASLPRQLLVLTPGIHSPHGHLVICVCPARLSCRVNSQGSKTRRKRCPGTQPERGYVPVTGYDFPKIHPPFPLSSFQAQFRFAAQKLGQLQDKFESQAQVTKGDIATLLRQGNIGLARAKAESVIKDEIHTDLLQVLEMYLGVVLEQFAEIEKKYSSPHRIVASSHLLGCN